MTDFDPSDHTIPELGPALKDIEDVDELEEILEKEQAGEDRKGAVTLIESRIEKFTDDGGDGDDEWDLEEMSPADVGNRVKDIDDVGRLEELVEAEEAGEDRGSVKRLIENRIDSVQGSAEEEGDGEDEAAPQTPEEKHPELDHPTADKQWVEGLQGGTYRDMWVYCETQQGELVDVSLEMLGKARELMDGYAEDYDEEERVVAVLIGSDVEKHTETVIEHGADVVVYQEDDRLDRFYHKPYTEIFCDMSRGVVPREDVGKVDSDEDWRDYDEPRYTLFPATNNGRDLSALVQGELDSGLASDCSGLTIEDTVISNPAKTGEAGTKEEFERILHMKRPDFSGFEYSTILCIDKPDRDFHPQGGSVIPGSFEVPDPDPEREGEVVEWDTEIEDAWMGVQVTDHDVLDEGVDLTGRDVIVALGRGIGDDPTRGMELGIELADAFDDADVGVSRGIVTGSYNFDGHVEQYTAEERQLGETGQVVEPQLYIAAGISGAVQHKVGVDEADTIVAVNTDPDARIYDWCDYFVEGDLFDVLPRLVEAAESGELTAEAMEVDD
jgi:electron transfer flavoprotein alpha subunit